MKTKDLRPQTDDQIATALGELKREQFNLRFQAATGQMEKPSRVREVRRTIAKIKTLQGQRAAGGPGGCRHATRSQVMPKRILQGKVVSDKGDKTVIVLIERKITHPVYGKIMRRSKKYHAHDEGNVIKEGDEVRIEECAPLSKLKTFKVLEKVG